MTGAAKPWRAGVYGLMGKIRVGMAGICPKVQGSFTVEAALVFPLVLFCILHLLNQGIELYCLIREMAGNQEAWEGFDPASRFRQLELLGNFMKL